MMFQLIVYYYILSIYKHCIFSFSVYPKQKIIKDSIIHLMHLKFSGFSFWPKISNSEKNSIFLKSKFTPCHEDILHGKNIWSNFFCCRWFYANKQGYEPSEWCKYLHQNYVSCSLCQSVSPEYQNLVSGFLLLRLWFNLCSKSVPCWY